MGNKRLKMIASTLLFFVLCGLSGKPMVDATPRHEERNVALGANAVQSSTGYEGPASKAVDGNLEVNYFVQHCTHTFQQSNPWWRVDLSRTYNITRIAITNRGDCCEERLNGAQIHVGDSLENNGNSNKKVAVVQAIPSGYTLSLRLSDAVGRYVNIFLPGKNKYLTLCEVQVFADVIDELKAYRRPEEVGLHNVAISGTATQSSLNSAGTGIANNAIDGNRNSDMIKGSCTQTAQENSPWWRVNLHHRYTISSVALTNREDCCSEDLNGAEIRVGYSLKNNGRDNPLCATVSSIAAGQTEYFNCRTLVEGRYVFIILPGGGTLSLCEVEVFGTRF